MGWPTMWTEANAATPFEPWPSVPMRYQPSDGSATFLGRWGGYDVWTYNENRAGISLVTKNGARLAYFPLAGMPPLEEGKVWVDGALAVTRMLKLPKFEAAFRAGQYGRVEQW